MGMLQVFSSDLSKVSLYAQGDEIGTVMGKDVGVDGKRQFSYPLDVIQHVIDIEKPVLVTDYYAIHSISDYLTRETVYMLYSKPIRVTEYDGYQMYFEQRNYLGVRGPSVDTLFLCKALRDYDFFGKTTLAEIGSGPGFVGRYISHKHPLFMHTYYNDINPKAQKYYDDCKLTGESTFVLGDGTKFLEQQKLDVVICNPPYIPRPQSIDDNPYEGLSLVQRLVSHMHTYLQPGGKLFLNISSLSRKQFLQFVQEAGVKIRLLDSMHVPLKVFTVLHNIEWMNYLKQECDLEDNFHDGHQWWHTLEVYEISL